MIAAVTGGWLDTCLSRFLDAMNSIPSKLFGLVVVAAVGSSIPALILTLAVIYIPGAYRFARALAVNINTMDFMTVARVRGESTAYLIGSEILPNIIRPVLADFGLRFVFIVLLLSGLSFLGHGLQPPLADWGALVRENIGGLPFAAPAVIVPSLAIASLTISVNLLIDNLPQKIRDRDA
jgi:peptide/nickel transport system permease protein